MERGKNLEFQSYIRNEAQSTLVFWGKKSKIDETLANIKLTASQGKQFILCTKVAVPGQD